MVQHPSAPQADHGHLSREIKRAVVAGAEFKDLADGQEDVDDFAAERASRSARLLVEARAERRRGKLLSQLKADTSRCARGHLHVLVDGGESLAAALRELELDARSRFPEWPEALDSVLQSTRGRSTPP